MGSLHKDIEEFILSKVDSGEYPPGSKIPTEAELQSMFGVSRITVRSALERLKERGVLVSRPGKGTFVRFDLPERRVSSLALFPLERFPIKVIKFQKTAPPGYVKSELGLDSGKVFFLLDVRFLDGEPVSLCRSYVSFSSVPDFSPGSGSMVEVLKGFGVNIVRSTLSLDQAKAQSGDAKLLGIKTGYPLLRIRRVLYTDLGNPTCYSVFLIKGERVSLNLSLGGPNGLR